MIVKDHAIKTRMALLASAPPSLSEDSAMLYLATVSAGAIVLFGLVIIVWNCMKPPKPATPRSLWND
jgi:hypothetical protein